jgi:hypothetical protein
MGSSNFFPASSGYDKIVIIETYKFKSSLTPKKTRFSLVTSPKIAPHKGTFRVFVGSSFID